MTSKLKFFTGLFLSAALGIGSAIAQINGTLGVTLPQNVTASGVKLPAGQYSIQELSGSGLNTVLILRSASGFSTNVLVEPIMKAQQKTATESSVTLHQVRGSLQLDEIWIAGSEVGYHILSSDR